MVSMLKGAELDASVDEHPDFQEPHEVALGHVYIDKEGRKYKYVKFNQDVDIEEGDAVEYADVSFGTNSTPTDPKVTDVVVSGATSGGGNAIDDATAGMALTSHPTNTDGEARYGWIQVSGPAQNLTDASNGVAAGDYVMPDSSNDGEWTTATTDAEYRAGAIAVTAASGGSFDAILISD